MAGASGVSKARRRVLNEMLAARDAAPRAQPVGRR